MTMVVAYDGINFDVFFIVFFFFFFFFCLYFDSKCRYILNKWNKNKTALGQNPIHKINKQKKIVN